MASTDASIDGLHVHFKGLDVGRAPADDQVVDGPVPNIEEEWKPDVEGSKTDIQTADDGNKLEVPNVQVGEEAPKKKKKKKKKSKGSKKFVSIYFYRLNTSVNH